MFYKSTKKSSSHSQGEEMEAEPMHMMNDAQQPPPMMVPQDPYPKTTSMYPEQAAPPQAAPFNSYNPYPTGNPTAPQPMAPPAAFDAAAPNYKNDKEKVVISD